MHRVKLLLFCFFLSLLAATPGDAWFGGEKPLVSINAEQYRADDFKNWWQNWQDENQPVPENLEPFIEWQLMAAEAKKMELYKEPNYQRKIAIFLKVRALMLLKNEEIDSKISIDEQDIRQDYQINYTPRQMVQMFFFADSALATAAYKKLQDGTSTTSDIKVLPPDKGGPAHYQEMLLRPINTPAAWQKTLGDLNTGEISQPIAWRDGAVLLKKDTPPTGDDEQDFDTLKRKIGGALADKQKDQLSTDLQNRLYQKYNVQVDRELLALIPMDNTPLTDELAGKPIISTNQINISAADFMDKIKNEQSFRKDYGFKKDEAEALKQRVLNGILSQTLTTWESLNRHYENKPPFQTVYEFYCQHRLIKELENRLFTPEATTNTQEITAYYKEHLEEFSLPAAVTIATVSGDEATAKKIWTGVIMGEDFLTLAKKYSESEPQPRLIPLNHLDPELNQAILPLAIGEVSPPFKQNNTTTLVKLIGREPGGPLPLSQVGDKIGTDLIANKISRLRAEFIDKLKAKSTISVDNRAWQALKKELGGGK